MRTFGETDDGLGFARSTRFRKEKRFLPPFAALALKPTSAAARPRRRRQDAGARSRVARRRRASARARELDFPRHDPDRLDVAGRRSSGPANTLVRGRRVVDVFCPNGVPGPPPDGEPGHHRRRSRAAAATAVPVGKPVLGGHAQPWPTSEKDRQPTSAAACARAAGLILPAPTRASRWRRGGTREGAAAAAAQRRDPRCSRFDTPSRAPALRNRARRVSRRCTRRRSSAVAGARARGGRWVGRCSLGSRRDGARAGGAQARVKRRRPSADGHAGETYESDAAGRARVCGALPSCRR